MEARTGSSYGRYVNPRAAAGRRAGDSVPPYVLPPMYCEARLFYLLATVLS